MPIVYLLVLLGILGAAGWFGWRYFGASGGALFGGNREARIGVSEIASIDGKRKLLLIHRDGVEHLVMTGGPVDVVIEQGIQPQRRPGPAAASYAQAPSSTAAPVNEPRLMAQQPASLAAAEAGPELPPGFGRLRQRPAAAPAGDPQKRGEAPNHAVSGGNR